MRRFFASLATTATPLRFVCCLFVLSLALLPVLGAPTWTAAAEPPVQGDEHFAMNWINPPSRPASALRLRQASDSGARWDRFPFWNEIQPVAGGAIDFSRLDKAVDADLANGLRVQAVLLDAPQWAMASGQISMDAWRSYVSATVRHFKGRVSAWEIWNEPDLTQGDGSGVFWHWSVADYYQLLKTGYSAIKAADPTATVVMGALACPDYNLGFFPRLLDEMARDATAAQNNRYCDVLSVHLYSRPVAVYDMPTGYVGTPEFAGFHNLMRQYGFDKPIWVTETGIGIWDTMTGVKGPGRATMAEHAAYVIQAYAYALAAGVDRLFLFQFYDDGPGADDPAAETRAELYGLFSNAGEQRVGYSAYQTAARYFSNAQLVTRVNTKRDGSADVKGVEVITLYGTPQGKVTVLWSYDGSSYEQVRLAAAAPAGALVDRLGQQQDVSASDGAYALTLARATNNNNPGDRVNDFIVGGDPTILVEPDSYVPAVAIKALPSGVRAPFTVSWATTRSTTGAVTYDIQVMDAADGVWRSWIGGTSATSAQFGAGDATAQLSHTYVFRARVRDAAGNLFGGRDFSGNGMAGTVVLGGAVGGPLALPPAPPIVGVTPADAKIQLVWPHGGAPVTQASKANIGAYVFARSSLASVNSAFDRPVTLYRALNNGVEEAVATGRKTLTSKGGLQFPTWEFDDVDVSQARDPLNKYFFRVGVDGQSSVGNVWAHGTDPRTYFPQTDVPKGILRTAPAQVDGKVEIVWPHDSLPVKQATRANIGVYLFGHGTQQSVPTSYDRPVKLLQSLNNGVEREIATGVKVMKSEGGLTFPTWQFNDVDVSAARDGSSQYYFRVAIEGVRTFSNVWSHGTDARTYFPQPDVPTGVLP